jgi:hypothetical protein
VFLVTNTVLAGGPLMSNRSSIRRTGFDVWYSRGHGHPEPPLEAAPRRRPAPRSADPGRRSSTPPSRCSTATGAGAEHAPGRRRAGHRARPRSTGTWPTRTRLVDLIVDRVAGEVPAARARPGPLAGAAAGVADRVRAGVRAPPGRGRPDPGPDPPPAQHGPLGRVDPGLLRGAGIPDRDRRLSGDLLGLYLGPPATRPPCPADLTHGEPAAPRRRAMMPRLLRVLPADQFPNVVATWTSCSAAGRGALRAGPGVILRGLAVLRPLAHASGGPGPPRSSQRERQRSVISRPHQGVDAGPLPPPWRRWPVGGATRRRGRGPADRALHRGPPGAWVSHEQETRRRA